MIDKLNEVCDKLISLNNSDYEKFVVIKKILNKADAFINMDIEYAYSILRDLEVPEEDIKNVYLELIDPCN